MTKIRKCSCKRLAKARYDYYSESKEVSVGGAGGAGGCCNIHSVGGAGGCCNIHLFCRFTAMDMTGHF